MQGLIVVRTDNMDTSSCIITSQKVNFLLNGKGVPGRINTAMESKPQLPTNLAAIAKYGVNLLQVVGNFDGIYSNKISKSFKRCGISENSTYVLVARFMHLKMRNLLELPKPWQQRMAMNWIQIKRFPYSIKASNSSRYEATPAKGSLTSGKESCSLTSGKESYCGWYYHRNQIWIGKSARDCTY